MTAVWFTSFDVNQLGEVQFVLAVIFMTTLVIGAIVTENNAIFKELVRKDVFHSSLIEHAPDGINMLSRDFQIDYLSPSSQKILGHDPGALIGTFLTDYIHPDDIKPAQDLLHKIIANDGATAMAEYRFKHADGGWIWLESTFTNLLGEKDVDKIVINFRDITERKRSAQEITDTQARFENVVNSANDAILSMDEHQNIILFNRGAERIFGIKSEEALGMPLTTFLPDAPTRTHQQFIDQHKEIDTFTVLPNLVYGRRINGDRFPADINISQVTFKGKTIFSVFLRDVSKHMQAEEQVRTSKDDLQTLYEFSHTLAQTFTLEEILKIINKYTVDSINLTYSRIALLEDGFYVMRSVYPPFPRGNDMLIGEGFPPESLPTIQRVVEQNKPALILADKSVLSEEEYRILRLDFTKSLYILPLCLGSDETFDKRILGVLMLGEMRSEEREPITPGKMRLAQTIADTSAVAIRRLILAEQTNQQINQMISLRKIDQVITSGSDLASNLDKILDILLESLKMDAASVWIYQPDKEALKFFIDKGFKVSVNEKTGFIYLGDGFAGRAALERTPIFIEEISRDKNARFLSLVIVDNPFVGYCAIPLIIKDKVLGVLELYKAEKLSNKTEWRDYCISLATRTAVAIENASLFNDLEKRNYELMQAYDATIQGWSRALDLRDHETEGHTSRVTQITADLAKLFGFSEDELIHIRRGAILHDIGKMGVPDEILLKPGPLSEEEWEVMRRHPEFAFDMLSQIDFLQPAIDIPYSHHEKWDGSGYPQGLTGESIPLSARMFAVVDVWDALLSDRPYRKAWQLEDVLNHIRSLAGTHFDPQVVKIILDSGFLSGDFKVVEERPLMTWNEDLNTGIPEIDAQHQRLIKIVNRLILAARMHHIHPETITNIFSDLAFQLKIHFKDEERLMTIYNYPGYEAHCELHRSFKENSAEFSKKISEGTLEFDQSFVDTTVRMIVKHIEIDDMAYRPYIIK